MSIIGVIIPTINLESEFVLWDLFTSSSESSYKRLEQGRKLNINLYDNRSEPCPHKNTSRWLSFLTKSQGRRQGRPWNARTAVARALGSRVMTTTSQGIKAPSSRCECKMCFPVECEFICGALSDGSNIIRRRPHPQWRQEVSMLSILRVVDA